MSEEHQKIVFPIDPSWPRWKRWAFKFLNVSPVFLWIVITLFLIKKFNTSLLLTEYRDLYLNIISVSGVFNILTFIAGIVLITFFNPWIRPAKIMSQDSDLLKLGLFLYWGLTTLSLAIVIYAAN